MNPVGVCCVLFALSFAINIIVLAICFASCVHDVSKRELKEKILEQKILLDIYKKDISDDDLREAMKQYYKNNK